MSDNVDWSLKLNRDYRAFSQSVIESTPQAATAIAGYRSGPATTFANAVGQNGRFDYQRPPNADMFLTFYTNGAAL